MLTITMRLDSAPFADSPLGPLGAAAVTLRKLADELAEHSAVPDDPIVRPIKDDWGTTIGELSVWAAADY